MRQVASLAREGFSGACVFARSFWAMVISIPCLHILSLRHSFNCVDIQVIRYFNGDFQLEVGHFYSFYVVA
jgi:hypothetical protein